MNNDNENEINVENSENSPEENAIPLSEDFSVDLSKYPNLKMPNHSEETKAESSQDEVIEVTKEDFKAKNGLFTFVGRHNWTFILCMILALIIVATIAIAVARIQPSVSGLWVSEDGKVLFFTKDTMLNIDLRHNEMFSEHYNVKGKTLYITQSDGEVTEHSFKIKKDVLTIDKDLMIFPEYTRQENKRDILLKLISVDAQVESYGRELELSALKLQIAESVEDSDYDIEYLKSYMEFLQSNIDNLEQERDSLLLSLEMLKTVK